MYVSFLPFLTPSFQPFMINRYARKLLILSLGIMLITKSNLCKKASCWERAGKRSSGVCKEEQRGRQSMRHVGGMPSAAVGGDRRLQMDTSRSGLLARTHLHCSRLRATKPALAQGFVSRTAQLLTKPRVLHPIPLCFFP